MRPSWKVTLKDVLKHDTVMKKMISSKGTEYNTEVIENIVLLSTGSVQEINGKYKYAIVDPVHNLEYEIKTNNRLDVKFGQRLLFKNLRGGATDNGNGWYSADSVEYVRQ